jgi:hypothetical protein
MAERVEYAWRYDTDYYVAVVDRYYQQLPFFLHLPSQFGILWLAGLAIYLAATADVSVHSALWAILIGAVGIPAGISLTRKAILLKYRIRPSFNSECTYSMSEAGLTIQSKSVRGTFEWSEYSRAVRFPDGILLLRQGAIRWLPDSAILAGTPTQATELVRARLPIRCAE